jgi:hypothetical protein
MKLLLQLIVGFLLIQGSPNWGQEVAGHFYPEKQDYRVGEPIFIVLELTNVGTKVIQLDDASCASETRFEAITAWRRLSPDAPPSGIAFSCGSTITPWSPGVTVRRRFLLQGSFQLDSPGIYTIRGHHTVWLTAFGEAPGPGKREEIITDFDVSLHAEIQTGEPAAQPDKSFRITIPHDIRPEDVQLSYFLTGPFGGYGLSARVEAGKHEYVINTTFEGKMVTSLKAVVYAPGCQTAKIAVPSLSSSQRKAEFTCKPLPSLVFRGKIQPAESLTSHEYEIEVNLIANWAMNFFGILDGIVPTFRVANATSEKDGSFRVQLPAFTQDAVNNSYGDHGATLHFMAREKQTGKILGLLEPTDKKYGEYGDVRLQSAYPDEVIFRVR